MEPICSAIKAYICRSMDRIRRRRDDFSCYLLITLKAGETIPPTDIQVDRPTCVYHKSSSIRLLRFDGQGERGSVRSHHLAVMFLAAQLTEAVNQRANRMAIKLSLLLLLFVI